MTPPLRFGIVHDFRCPPGSDIPMPQVYAETFEQIELADEWGLDLCWFTEHHFVEDGYLPNFVPVAGAAAARTKRIRFSTDICLLPFVHPIRLAEDLAVLDNISNGRMELGAGLGYASHEFAGFGIPRSRRVSLSDETLTILRQAWSGEPVNFEGKRYQFNNVRVTPDPVQPGGPPLWVAAMSEPGAMRAAHHNTNLLPQGASNVVLEPWQAELRATGRNPADYRVGIIRGVFVTDDVEREWEAVVKPAERYRRQVYAGFMDESTDEIAMSGATPLNPLVWTVGSVDHCVNELTSFMIEQHVTDLVTWGGPPGLAPSAMNASLERFAKEVVPQVRINVDAARPAV
jgi:alkanesulfonate monooxygenase SsuD/methylene tetrahydromethanopterin reductase-like flavin-dependent oxidoreductase (luciferase family)